MDDYAWIGIASAALNLSAENAWKHPTPPGIPGQYVIDPRREPPVADEKKTERMRAEEGPGTSRQGADPKAAPERNFFDQWVDRRLKTMHDAVLDEKIPDDMLRMLLGDVSGEQIIQERGTSDDANRPQPDGNPDADPRAGRDRRH
ncbi:hypothetical protein STHU_06180 [Allostella humosa]|uniref:hypothetical protein n=1 Tax=Stella humosa TaxID=94 RepID=UPI001135DAB9|nr:hypothetical protein [Stella humosa]BBK29984.1 hypothetical protein STHU_06180 [Stella humosa]